MSVWWRNTAHYTDCTNRAQCAGRGSQKSCPRQATSELRSQGETEANKVRRRGGERGKHSRQREQYVLRCWARREVLNWLWIPGGERGSSTKVWGPGTRFPPVSSPPFALRAVWKVLLSMEQKLNNNVENEVCPQDMTHHQLRTGTCRHQLATVSGVPTVRKHGSLPLTQHGIRKMKTKMASYRRPSNFSGRCASQSQ